ncbi:hypothetical protein [Nocardioides sp.]|uniref:hypothetical protein n=1 Tax=Nocardioides sp. TaxID=35761 RepID=UPI003516D6EB
MSTDPTPLEQRLLDTLHDRAAEAERLRGTTGSDPLGLDAVRGRAGAIRRRRRATVAAAVGTLAAAAVVPVALLALQSGERTAAPDPAATVPTTGATYLTGDVLHRADGTTRALPGAPGAGFDQAVELDGYLITARSRDDGTRLIAITPPDGVATDLFEGGIEAAGPFVLDSDRDRILFQTGPEGRTVQEFRVTGDGAATTILGTVPAYSSLDVVLPGDAAALAITDGSTGALRYFVDGSLTEVGPESPAAGLLGYTDVEGDLATGVVISPDDPNAYCGRWLDLAAPEGSPDATVLLDCEHRLERIAPDGAHVSAVGIETDGPGAAALTVLDRTGAEVTRYDPDGDRFVADAVWSDAEHLLVLTGDVVGAAWQVERLALDGSVEVLAGPAAGTAGGTDAPFALQD